MGDSDLHESIVLAIKAKVRERFQPRLDALAEEMDAAEQRMLDAVEAALSGEEPPPPARKRRKDAGKKRLGKTPLSEVPHQPTQTEREDVMGHPDAETAGRKRTLEPVPILNGRKACAVCRERPHASGDVRCHECRDAKITPTPEQLDAFEAAVIGEAT